MAQVWAGLSETRRLTRDAEVDLVQSSGAVVECIKERIAREVPAGRTLALVDTDTLLGQVLAERLTPRYEIADRPAAADVLVSVARNDVSDCAKTVIAIRPAQ